MVRGKLIPMGAEIRRGRPFVVNQEESQSKLDRLAMALERARIGEYVSLMQDPLRVLYINFLAGVSRGLGMAVGFTILGALVIYALQRLMALDLPLVGKLIADLIEQVQRNMIR